ncbi:MAG: J domain-containing protein [Paracoccaceae bacterium]|nr:J domain-containing protein [Paracoccaceae bacterium]
MPHPFDPSASPYDILGVSPCDEFATIRAAWRRLVKTWHPDVWHGSADEAMRRMQAVNDAYDTIARRHKRVQEEMAKEAVNAKVETSKPRRRAPLRDTQVKAGAPPRPPARPLRRHPAEGCFAAARGVMNGVPEATVLGVA